jgi:beta-galactosidase
MVAVDFSRSANLKNGGLYVGELQAGKGTIGLQIGNPITPEDHRIWMWSAVAKGARAINIYAYYPMSSGYESGGYGLINLDGTITERAKHAGQTAKFIDENKALFLASKPVKAEIALVYNPLAQMVGGEQRYADFDGHQNSLFGYYRFFAEHNIPVDFIHRKNLEAGEFSQYKLIIVPYPLMFSQQAADGLKNFVMQGGFVLAEARLAWNDERGFAAQTIPGMGLDEVFGAQETSVKMSDKVTMKIIKNSHPALEGFDENDSLKGAYFAESIEPIKNQPSQILASLEDGTPVIIASKYGKGETLLLGSFLGMANHPDADQNNNRFLMNLLDWAKITRPFTTSHDGKIETPVEVRMQTNSNGWLMFLINHGANDESVNIQIRVAENRKFSCREIISNKAMELKYKNFVLDINAKILRKDVQIWRITL